METRFSYFLVGFFILIAIAAGLFFIGNIFLKEKIVNKNTYGVVYEGSVEGLKKGSSVSYNGIKIGNVRYIGLDKIKPTSIYLEIDIDKRVIINSSTQVSLISKGFTGRSALNVSTRSSDADALVKERGRKYPLLKLTKTNFSAVVDKITKILEKTEQTIVTLNGIIAFNEKYINDTLVNVNLLSKDIRGILSQFSQTINIINNVGGGFNKKVDVVFTSLSNLLIQAELLTKDTRGAVQSVARIISTAEQNPSGFIFQGRSGVVQLPKYETVE